MNGGKSEKKKNGAYFGISLDKEDVLALEEDCSIPLTVISPFGIALNSTEEATRRSDGLFHCF